MLCGAIGLTSYETDILCVACGRNFEGPPFLLETSHPGVFAAGDARTSSVKRVASAVGEGAMTVKFGHEYLKEV